jgi:hypothetical protein
LFVEATASGKCLRRWSDVGLSQEEAKRLLARLE